MSLPNASAFANKELRVFYDAVYDRGESRHYTKLLKEPGKTTVEKLAVLGLAAWRGKRVLDIGCGTGEMAYLIARKGAKQVVGLDYSEAAIRVAREQYEAPNLSYTVEDALKAKGEYDVVLAMGMLEHVDNPFSMLRRFARLVAPGGQLIITAPNWTNPRGYMLLMLKHLFDARITLADLHYFTPIEFGAWAKKLGMKLSWQTVLHDWGAGSILVSDFAKRLPSVFRDSTLPFDEKKLKGFLAWLSAHLPLEEKTKTSGAIGIYQFKKGRK